MKIGIFTFHCAVNYGAVLQTYCLQEVLKGMGHEVYVIDYRPRYLIEPYKIFSYNPASFGSYFAKCKGGLRACLVFPIRWKRNKVFSKFINSCLNLYKLDLKDESNDFDAFVFGSDQIWNPKITCGFDNVYLGDFPAAKGKKLIAYAASVGCVANLYDEDIEYFFSCIKKFDIISVREETLARYIKEKLLLDIPTMLDPVLLGGINVIAKLTISKKKRYISKEPYLLLFQLGRNNEIANYAIKLANTKRLKIVEIITSGESIFNSNIGQTLSINELLLYFKNASYVVTASFHGTVISLLFEKQFEVILRRKDIDERIVLLLDSLKLSQRMINLKNIVKSPFIDYSQIALQYKYKQIKDFVFLKDMFKQIND